LRPVLSKYISPREILGRVACCPLVSRVEYVPYALLMLGKWRDRQTDGRTPDRFIRLTIRYGTRWCYGKVVR